MGMGFRIFFIDDDDSLERISLAQYERLCRKHSKDRLPQYAGKRVRCAMVVLDVEDRKPQSITWIDCCKIPFDAEGGVDLEEWEKRGQLVSYFLDLPVEEQGPEKIIDARSLFAKKQYEREAKWSLTPEIEQAIEETIFGRSTGFPRIG